MKPIKDKTDQEGVVDMAAEQRGLEIKMSKFTYETYLGDDDKPILNSRVYLHKERLDITHSAQIITATSNIAAENAMELSIAKSLRVEGKPTKVNISFMQKSNSVPYTEKLEKTNPFQRILNYFTF